MSAEQHWEGSLWKLKSAGSSLHNMKMGPRHEIILDILQTVVLEKTLESPLDSEEVKPVHPKENQS